MISLFPFFFPFPPFLFAPDTDTDTDTGNVQSRTYAMGEAAIHDRARTTPDHFNRLNNLPRRYVLRGSRKHT